MHAAFAELFPRGRRSGRVLVAGGRSEDRVLIRDVLRADGHDVTLARSAEDAIAQLTETPRAFEVVVLHARAAETTRRDLLSEIASCATTILVVDEAARSAFEERARGLAAVVSEPYALDDLRVVVTSVADRAARRRAN